ncbi:MAG: hypothetical protein WBD27_08480 [Pyrinomonadaceae bacterium]
MILSQKNLGSDAKIEYVEGLDHFNLNQGGLSDRIANEIYAVSRPKLKASEVNGGEPRLLVID